jgi:hypothetical protein
MQEFLRMARPTVFENDFDTCLVHDNRHGILICSFNWGQAVG